jgi:hypothetical protein
LPNDRISVDWDAVVNREGPAVWRAGNTLGSRGATMFGTALRSSIRRSMAPAPRCTSPHISLSEAVAMATYIA